MAIERIILILKFALFRACWWLDRNFWCLLMVKYLFHHNGATFTSNWFVILMFLSFKVKVVIELIWVCWLGICSFNASWQHLLIFLLLVVLVIIILKTFCVKSYALLRYLIHNDFELLYTTIGFKRYHFSSFRCMILNIWNHNIVIRRGTRRAELLLYSLDFLTK